jgi:CMP-N,N'-diacetyllegionaminic acid synthase
MGLDLSQCLVVIPARKGSKGIPGKNGKLLCNKPLVSYTIEKALHFFPAQQICLSTDCENLADIGKSHGLSIPFLRNEKLSSDTASSREVILDAVQQWKKHFAEPLYILLLQPTSPFRRNEDFIQIFDLFNEETDLVVSVVKSKANPYFTLFEEDENGWLNPSKKSEFTDRQSIPACYQYNGAFYLFRAALLADKPFSEFRHIKKHEMSALQSVDLDEPIDWEFAELLLKKGYIDLA